MSTMFKNMFLRTSTFLSKSSDKTESMPFPSFLKKTLVSIIGVFALCNSSSTFAQVSAYNLSSLQSAASSMLQGGSSVSTSTVRGDSKGSGSRSVKSTSRESSISDSLRASTEMRKTGSDDSATLTYRKKIFGYSIFNNDRAFSANIERMATPKNYVLGPDDEVIIDITGYSEAHYTLPVTPDGYIKVEKVGSIFVNGLTIEEAKHRIVNRMSQIFVGLKSFNGYSANTTATISLGSIRTIKVNVIGEVIAPGTYSMPSLADVMVALRLAGGPNVNGTFREIKVIRGKKLVAQVDLYDLLTTGNLRQNITLKDQDIVQVGYYKNRIEVLGNVKKPAVFEIHGHESLERIITDYAGGFTPEAYREVLKVQRFTDKDLKLIDLNGDLLSSFYPKPGDLINVDKILVNRYENVVKLSGAVFRPGRYSVTDNQTLTKLIKRADGFTEDAFLTRIEIIRINDDLTKTSMAINYKDLMNGKVEDVVLKRQDEVMIYSSHELIETQVVRIQGEINLKVTAPTTTDVNGLGAAPVNAEAKDNGVFPFLKNMTVEDLIIKAGGLKESAATGRVEVIRRKKNIGKDDPSQITPVIGERYQFAINPDLSINEQASKFILEPYDEVFVRSSPNYEKQQFVSVEGQVVFPSTYGLERKDEKIEDVVRRAGGLNKQAYPKGATLIRQVKMPAIEVERRRKQAQDLADARTDEVVKVEEIKEFSQESIGINLVEALSDPTSDANMILQDGDILRIPKEPQTVRVQGELLYPTSTRFMKGMPFKHYISEAGGFTELSSRKRAYIIYANGSVDRTHKVLGLVNIYPKVEPGSEIIVPKLNLKTGTSQQLMSVISTVSASLSGIVTIVGLIRILK